MPDCTRIHQIILYIVTFRHVTSWIITYCISHTCIFSSHSEWTYTYMLALTHTLHIHALAFCIVLQLSHHNEVYWRPRERIYASHYTHTHTHMQPKHMYCVLCACFCFVLWVRNIFSLSMRVGRRKKKPLFVARLFHQARPCRIRRL